MDIAVTGYGVISSIGQGAEASLASLKAKTRGLEKLTGFESKHNGVLYAGMIKRTNDELIKSLSLDGERPVSRTTLLGLAAAKEAVHHIPEDILGSPKTGIISGTSVAGMAESEIFYSSFINDSNSGNLNQVITHDCGDSTEHIARILGITGYVNTISTACSSSGNAITLGARLIKAGILDRVLVGGSDCLSMFTINGFNSLLIYDNELCKPFSEDRKGLNLGEGAGYLFLESTEVCEKERDSGIRVLGWANSCDAYHQTASSPEGDGAVLTMSGALKEAGLAPEDISYIKAHGTATPNNDLSEGKAIERVFEGCISPVSSTKGYTGHTLAASASIETVFSILSMKEGFLLPNVGYTSKIPELTFTPQLEAETAEVKNVLINSFGFGGNNTTVILGKED
jgi:3-oxoacyl-[acyl-carrier-protein] synthase-1